jgi:DnaA family protein
VKQLTLPIGPELPVTFEAFVPGANAAALELLRTLRVPSPPVYLWGPPGSGKTHLLRALTNAQQRQGVRTRWLDASAALPWAVDDGCALATVDDVHGLDAARQHAAFALFVEAAAGALQIVAAGRWPPVDLPVREDLRTRLGWGHVFALEPLGEAHARGALRHEADRRGLALGDEVLDYLLARFDRDMKNLVQMLDRLDAYALSEHRPRLTVPLLKRMLAETAAPR